jgi:hypothetical protein
MSNFIDFFSAKASGGEKCMIRQEAALLMSCYIVGEVNTMSIFYPQPAGYK